MADCGVRVGQTSGSASGDHTVITSMYGELLTRDWVGNGVCGVLISTLDAGEWSASGSPSLVPRNKDS
jgi:hypothetical protein